MALETYHASCVAFGENAVLIMGASGAGKSALALQLIGLGGVLIADDRVILANADGLSATCPPAIKGKIEARGVGILNADVQDTAQVTCVVDLDRTEVDRLPQPRIITIKGIDIPLFYKVTGIHFPYAIAQFMRMGRSD
jgi:HPr kinase/phosphorylase